MSVINIPVNSTTLTLNSRVYRSLAEGDEITLAPVNDSTSQSNAADGGVIITARSDREVHDLTVRVQKHSDDDASLNALRNSPSTLINGSIKTSLVRDGVDLVDTYLLSNGSVTTQPTETSNHTDGSPMLEYVIRFRSAQRAF